MKIKIFKGLFLLIFFVTGTSLCACSHNRILSDLPSGEGVEKVYISEALINMGLQNHKNTFNYEGMNGDIQGVEVYNCSNTSLSSLVKSKIEEILKKYKADIMIESQENGETSKIYTLYDEKAKEKRIGMAIIEENNTEINVVILHGAYLR